MPLMLLVAGWNGNLVIGEHHFLIHFHPEERPLSYWERFLCAPRAESEQRMGARRARVWVEEDMVTSTEKGLSGQPRVIDLYLVDRLH